jgi:hypothetical protein
VCENAVSPMLAQILVFTIVVVHPGVCWHARAPILPLWATCPQYMLQRISFADFVKTPAEPGRVDVGLVRAREWNYIWGVLTVDILNRGDAGWGFVRPNPHRTPEAA